MSASSLPPNLPQSKHLYRWVFFPYGRGKGSSFTLSFYDTGMAAPEGGNWILYRFYQKVPPTPGKGTILFQGQEEPRGKQLADIAKVLLEAFCNTPGFRHAEELREEAKRLDWGAAESKGLRVDLEATHEFREGSHKYTLGIVSGQGDTQSEAKEALYAGIARQCSSHPRFRTGAASGTVYILYPQGSDWILQPVGPFELLPPVRFAADNVVAAERQMERLIARHEGQEVQHPSSTPPRARKQSRPSIRAVQA